MAATVNDDVVAGIRRFSRFYTRRIGVLNEAFLDSPFTLPEGRLVYEIAQRDETTASDLVRDLELDRGYVSRLLKGLEARDIVGRHTSAADARRSMLRLTAKGRRAFDKINRKSDQEVAKLLEPLGLAERRRLLAALSTTESLLADRSAPRPPCVYRDLKPGDLGWIIHRHGVLYAEEYGFDYTFEALVAGVCHDFVENFDADKERGWVAEINGRVVGSVFLVKASQTLAKLRLLYVDPEARGYGIGRQLVEGCVEQARQFGYKRMTLWTNDNLQAARQIYRTCGFECVASEPYHSFGQDLVAETWERDL